MLVKRMRWGLPTDAENTPHIWNHVAKFARQVISNKRGDWKKEVSLALFAMVLFGVS